MEFIFMLTRDDRTIADARRVYEEIAASGVQHVGCKDVGLERSELERLVADIRGNGHTCYLEVVSASPEDNLASARAAVELGVDALIGGTLVEPVLEELAGSGIRFFPYCGEIVGHPCLLRGSVARICADARHAEQAGADGVNLLAYRYDGSVPELVRAVTGATSRPVIAAGSVNSLERIRELGGLGVWAFTIGTAALDGAIVPGAPLAGQLEAILGATAAA